MRLGLLTTGRSSTGYPIIGDNIDFTGTAETYLYSRTDTAAGISFKQGNIRFLNAPSGTAGANLPLAERMVVDVNGDVGIGTTSPGALLDVNGTAKFAATIVSPLSTERFYPSVIGYSSGAVSSGAIIVHSPIARTGNVMFRMRVHGYGYNVGTTIDFTVSGYTYSGSNGSVDGVAGAIINYSLVDNGNDGLVKTVGIDAAGKVSVSLGDTALSAYLYRIYVDAWISSGSNYSTGWSIDRSTTAGFGWLDSKSLTSSLTRVVAGNVGIGTLAPAARLDVYGGTGSALYVTANTTNEGVIFDQTSTGTLFQIRKSGLAQVTVTNSGMVGIGNTSPDAPLVVARNGSDLSARFGSLTANTGAQIRLQGKDPTDTVFNYWDIRNNPDSSFTINGPTTGLTEKLRIASTGNVGIGSTTTTYKLDVAGAIRSTTQILNSSAVPTISSCGTTPPAATTGSNNNSGQFTLGTGATTACTVTFANAFPTAAFCTVTPASNYTGTYYISAQSASAFTVTLGTGTASVKFNYTCGGN